MAKGGGSTRTVSANNASASRTITEKVVLANNKNSINIKSIKGESPVRNINDDIIINGTVVYGSAKTERLREDAPKDLFMDGIQAKLMRQNPQFIRQIDRMGFTNEGGGVYTINTKIGGGQIESETDSSGNTMFNTHVWNATYNIWKDTKWGSLNTAKAYIKKKLKGS